MRLNTSWLLLVTILLCCISFINGQQQQGRRVRVRPRVQQIQQEETDEYDQDGEIAINDNRPQSAIQYYSAEPRGNSQSAPQSRLVLVSSDDDDYNGLYGQQTTPSVGRARNDYNRPVSKSTTVAPRTKEQGTKAPPVQTLRNYSKVNDDGSFTFGYEAADGSFKEETRGTDCVVRGKYGYVDPDGNKREFTYVSGNPCDPNHPDETEDDRDKSEEDPNEPENIPQNYPRRPIRPVTARPPIHTTAPSPPPTTVFQNNYAQGGGSYDNDDDSDIDDEQERPESIQLIQPQRSRPQPPQRPQHIQHQQQQQQQQQRPQQQHIPDEVTIRQRPRITYVNTTPSSLQYNSPTNNPVSITPRPTYRVPIQTLQTQPPATTYRPAVQFVTQRPADISYTKSSTGAPQSSSTASQHLSVEPITKSAYSSTRKPIDFAVEFQKFQQEHNVLTTSTTPRASTFKNFKPSQPIGAIQKIEVPQPTNNPIYESQLVYDPATGQYDSALYQQFPQSDGDFTINHRIQPYVTQQQFGNLPHLLSIEQLQQQTQQPIYQRPAPPPLQRSGLPSSQSPRPPPPPPPPPPATSALQFPQFSQQLYQKENENVQVVNSQQLFAQQQALQQQQLHQDRIEAAKRLQQQHNQQQQQQQQAHRFQLQPQLQRHIEQMQQQGQGGFYYVQQPQSPHQSTGQIDAFLRGHNIEFD